MVARGSAARKREYPRQTESRAVRADQFDKIIHERMRLGIVSALASTESLTFNELKDALNTTDGNISVHARKLEDAGYIVCHKGYEGRIPRTDYRLTTAGRRAFQKYLDHMEALVSAHRDR